MDWITATWQAQAQSRGLSIVPAAPGDTWGSSSRHLVELLGKVQILVPWIHLIKFLFVDSDPFDRTQVEPILILCFERSLLRKWTLSDPFV